MDSIITNDDRIAIAELDYIIHHMNERYLNKIPVKIRNCITILKKKNVDIYVDPKKPLESQGLREFTLYLLVIFNLKYWCSDERRKEIMAMLESNQRKFDAKVNNIFGQADSLKSSNDFENPASKPRQVTIVGNDAPKDNTIEQSNSTPNMIETLKKEEQSIVSVSNENIFIKIINKIKSKFIKK